MKRKQIIRFCMRPIWRSEYRFASANTRSNNSSVSPCTTRSPIYPTGPYLWTGSTRRSCAGNASRPISSQSCFSTSIASKISTTALGIGSAMNCCTASRLGGDEFAILLTLLTDVTDAKLVAERIQHELAAPFIIQGHAIFTSTSIGVALNTTLSYQHPDEILRDADTAMYQAKARGRARYVLFDPAMHVSAVARLRLEHDLRYALEREEFVLYYQPQVELNSGQVIGVEALIRWQHPERGLILPAEFIPIAEETGLIVPIGEWGLREACRQGKIWHTAGATGLKVAVNLSAGQFKHHRLPTVVADILAETEFDPQCLELELTESDTMEHADASVNTLRTLKSLGIGIAIDDFGTGYSSLSYLQRFPIDVVKIDRAFVRHSSADANDWTIAQTIIAMAHSLRLQVIAEGVETEEQRTFLANQGCQMAQGYLFSRPLPAEQLTPFLQLDQEAFAARV